MKEQESKSFKDLWLEEKDVKPLVSCRWIILDLTSYTGKPNIKIMKRKNDRFKKFIASIFCWIGIHRYYSSGTFDDETYIYCKHCYKGKIIKEKYKL